MKLIELRPRWAMDGSFGRRAMGLSFICPHCFAHSRDSEQRLVVFFDTPLDGGPPAKGKKLWKRSGDTFETLSLSPSIDASKSGHWHGYITNGEVR